MVRKIKIRVRHVGKPDPELVGEAFARLLLSRQTNANDLSSKTLPPWASKKRGSKEEMIRLGYPEADLVRDDNGQYAYAPAKMTVGRIKFREKAVRSEPSARRKSEPTDGPSEAEALVRRARVGDTEAALIAADRFVEAVDRGDNVPPEILEWVADALRTPLASINSALGFPKLSRGRQIDRTLSARDRNIARRVRVLEKAISGKKLKKAAILSIAQEFRVSMRTIESALRKYAEWSPGALARAKRDRFYRARAMHTLFPKEKSALTKK